MNKWVKWVDHATESRLVANDGEIVATVSVHRIFGTAASYHCHGKAFNTLDEAKRAAERNSS